MELEWHVKCKGTGGLVGCLEAPESNWSMASPTCLEPSPNMPERYGNGIAEHYVKNPRGSGDEKQRNSGACGSSGNWKYCTATTYLQAEPNEENKKDVNCKAEVGLQAVGEVCSDDAVENVDERHGDL